MTTEEIALAWFIGSTLIGAALLRYNHLIVAFRERESCPPSHIDVVVKRTIYDFIAVGTALAWILSFFKLCLG